MTKLIETLDELAQTAAEAYEPAEDGLSEEEQVIDFAHGLIGEAWPIIEAAIAHARKEAAQRCAEILTEKGERYIEAGWPEAKRIMSSAVVLVRKDFGL